ncbi:MAPEG family protein [Mesorhizobium comanense]|uniref:MAPEG family protein n=1 Tax=Mesorhizobium comanense TaxID=2502215 RepID=UPI0010F81918|nr:MAPEG family protein [Mesorhizobium comanense]
MEALAASSEIRVLGWSVILLLVHIVAQTLSLIKDGGLGYAMSNRDGEVGISLMTDRLTRGLRNFAETYGAFIALVVALAATGKVGGLAATGAMVWFWARVVYIPVFALGIPVARTGVWTVSIIGLVLMLVRLLA